MKIELGQVVYSKAGRDAGKKFVITSIIDDSSVFISDGELRKIEKAKKKKIKHLQLTEEVIDIIKLKLSSNLKVSNSDIKKSLNIFEYVIE